MSLGEHTTATESCHPLQPSHARRFRSANDIWKRQNAQAFSAIGQLNRTRGRSVRQMVGFAGDGPYEPTEDLLWHNAEQGPPDVSPGDGTALVTLFG
jgi:hypothetical protein